MLTIGSLKLSLGTDVTLKRFQLKSSKSGSTKQISKPSTEYQPNHLAPASKSCLDIFRLTGVDGPGYRL